MPKHIVIIAGEESGDCHAASLVKELLLTNQRLKISGIGGKHMQEAGVSLISDLAQFGVTGITAVIRHAATIKKAFTLIKNHLKDTKPDLLILVDYPGFNLRIAKFAKQELNLHIIYYISPQIWAWKANRIEKIRAYVDKMAVIFPFEKKMYQQAGISASFVGHPLITKLNPQINLNEARHILNLPIDKKVIALLPGSRRNEIEKHLPVLIKTAENLANKLPNLIFITPIAHTLQPELIKNYFKKSKINIYFTIGQAIETIVSCDCAIVASGTASLECALLQKPMCIIYKGSFLSYLIATQVIKVKYLGLCNLLQNRMIVPELLQYDCNAKELTKIVIQLLTDDLFQTQIVKQLSELKKSLSVEQADQTLAELVQEELN